MSVLPVFLLVSLWFYALHEISSKETDWLFSALPTNLDNNTQWISTNTAMSVFHKVPKNKRANNKIGLLLTQLCVNNIVNSQELYKD